MKLKMLMSPDPCEFLPANDNEILSVSMTECVTTIVMARPINDDVNGITYLDVRGYHALGYIGRTHWESLLGNLANTPDTNIFVFAGPDNRSAFAKEVLVTYFENTIANFGLSRANRSIEWAVIDVGMTRQAEIYLMRKGLLR